MMIAERRVYGQMSFYDLTHCKYLHLHCMWPLEDDGAAFKAKFSFLCTITMTTAQNRAF